MAERIEPTGRRAFFCSACIKAGVPPTRVFLPQGVTTKPACDEHGAVPMVRQLNRPYRVKRLTAR